MSHCRSTRLPTRFGSKPILTGPKIAVLTSPSQIKLEGLGLRSYVGPVQKVVQSGPVCGPMDQTSKLYSFVCFFSDMAAPSTAHHKRVCHRCTHPPPSTSHCKVVIPRGTGRSYGIRWKSEMRVTDETKGDGRTDGRTERIAQV